MEEAGRCLHLLPAPPEALMADPEAAPGDLGAPLLQRQDSEQSVGRPKASVGCVGAVWNLAKCKGRPSPWLSCLVFLPM